MSDNNSVLDTFLTDVKPTQQLWALQDKESQDWVVVDSLNYQETEVMPLWSSKALATEHCTEEWADYIAAEIPLAEWLELWVADLVEDDVVIGINWRGEDNDLEVDLAELTQALAEIENI